MGRTIPSFRIATHMEENKWKTYRKHLKKKEQKVFTNMFSIAYFFNSAYLYTTNPLRINPILFSIVLYHQKRITSSLKKGGNIFFFNSPYQR
jgi:hypothetical protein